MGVPADRFWIEPDSRTTRESGEAVKKLLDERFPESEQHRVALVTSARHTPRALLVFEQNGIDASPFPADIAGGSLVIDVMSFFPSHSFFASSIDSIHDCIGL